MEHLDGDQGHFVADTFSPEHGRITCIGTIAGDEISATFLWYKKEQPAAPEQVK